MFAYRAGFQRTVAMTDFATIRRISLRFWAKVEVGDAGDCWPWKGALDRHGYGQFKTTSGTPPVRAHRLAFVLTGNDPAAAPALLHTCHRRNCCNPGHLVPGTPATNHGDRLAAGRDRRDYRGRWVVLPERIELSASALPKRCSTTELRQQPTGE
jgi:hypothetical protein